MFTLRSTSVATLVGWVFLSTTLAQTEAWSESVAVPPSSRSVNVPAASTLYLPDSQMQFSVNIANDSSDVYFYLASPARGWVGVGFGSRMEDSLMVVVYADGEGSMFFISSRSARDE